jgi:ribosomal protein S18 acetylase RimI-like enzyme
MPKPEIRKAISRDVDVLVPVLARAFQPQPLTRWLLGSGRNALLKGERLMALELEKALSFDLTYTTLDRRGAALWHPPDKKIDLWRELVWNINSAAVMSIGPRSVSHLITGCQLALLQPRGHLFYLAILGVDPDSQGKGIGSALLEPGIQVCNQFNTPAYLVTDTQDAVRFYHRHGFRVRNKVPAFRADLTFWVMWRDPGD